MNNYPVILAILLVVAFLFAAHAKKNWRKWKYSKDIQFPLTLEKRKDLYFAFYGCQDNQVNETRGAFNLLFEGQFDGPVRCAQNILDAGVDTVLYVAGQLFSDNVPGQKHTVRADALIRLQQLFTMLQAKGALKYVKAICPIDEPNNTVGDAAELSQAIKMLRLVAADFPELNNFKLATFYAADKPFICQELYDWVGFDDYDMGSHVLVSDRYKKLVASLLPNQKTMIVPGAAYKQDPVPFVNFAQTAKEVVAIVAFVWFDARNADVGAPGARANGIGPQYLSAGRSVITH